MKIQSNQSKKNKNNFMKIFKFKKIINKTKKIN